MASDSFTTASVFAAVARTPAVQALRRRVEKGGALSCAAVSGSAQPFFAVLLRHLFPKRPLVVVTDGLKTQESFHQDIETWLSMAGERGLLAAGSESPTANRKSHFHPAWETLPHEAKLPHADVISERLETLVALTTWTSLKSESHDLSPPLIVTSVAALLQRTFRPQMIAERTRRLTKGDRIDPLDLVEWLEDQGYEPEAQVNHKGEIALRGGIVDVFPLTSPWPVRLEFFGDKLESLRYFDPISQISKEEIELVTIPPGGELGILKKRFESKVGNPEGQIEALATLLDYLPRETLFVFCEPEALDQHASDYQAFVPKDDPFFTSWKELPSWANPYSLQTSSKR